MRTVFFGTPKIAAEMLSHLIVEGVDVVAVVSKPDKPKGRSSKLVPTPVKCVAEERGIPLFQPEKASAPEFADTLKGFDADLFIVVAYGEIIKQHLLDMPKIGCINVHASLLPKYRGAAPIQRCIMAGERESGITIMHMVKKMDAGDIVLQKRVGIGPEMTAGELMEALTELGKEALTETLALAKAGPLPATAQDSEKVTMAPKLELEDGQLVWERSAEELHNQIRGVTPSPGAWCFVTIRGEKKRLKILKARVATSQEGWVIPCGAGSLELLEVQLEGKRRMEAGEFLRGIGSEKISF